MADVSIGIMAQKSSVNADTRADILTKVTAVVSPYTLDIVTQVFVSNSNDAVHNMQISLGAAAASSDWGIRLDWVLATLGQDTSVLVVAKITAVLAPHYAGATHVVLTTGAYTAGTRVFDYEIALS